MGRFRNQRGLVMFRGGRGFRQMYRVECRAIVPSNKTRRPASSCHRAARAMRPPGRWPQVPPAEPNLADPVGVGDDRAGARFHGTGGGRHRQLQGMVQPAPGEPRCTDRAQVWNEPRLDPAGYPPEMRRIRSSGSSMRGGCLARDTEPNLPGEGLGRDLAEAQRRDACEPRLPGAQSAGRPPPPRPPRKPPLFLWSPKLPGPKTGGPVAEIGARLHPCRQVSDDSEEGSC